MNKLISELAAILIIGGIIWLIALVAVDIIKKIRRLLRFSFWKSIFYIVMIGLSFIATTFYLILKKEGFQIPSLVLMLAFGCFFFFTLKLKRLNKFGEVEEKKTETNPTLFDKVSKIEKIKKIILNHKDKIIKYGVLSIIVIFIGALIIDSYQQSKKDERDCLRKIKFMVKYYRIEGIDRYFKTHDEAMNYCLNFIIAEQKQDESGLGYKPVSDISDLSFADKIRPAVKPNNAALDLEKYPYLTEQDRAKLDEIVSQMYATGESDADIQFVVNDFKSKYGLNSDNSFLYILKKEEK